MYFPRWENPTVLLPFPLEVHNQGLDYLLVRPMGVDPAELPRNSYRLLTAPCILRGLVLTFAGFGLRGSGFQD